MKVNAHLSRTLKLFLPICFFTLSCGSLLAQHAGEIDSLKQLLTGKEDSTQAELMLRIAERCVMFFQLDSAEKYTRLSLNLSDRSGFIKGTALGNSILGHIFSVNGEYNKSNEYINKALEWFKKTGDQRGMSVCLNNIGKNYYSLNDYEKCLEYYLLSLDIDKSLNDESGVVSTCVNIAIVHSRMENYDKAREYYDMAVHNARKSGNKYNLLISVINLAGFYQSLEMPDSALVYAREGFDISSDMQIAMGIIKSSSSLSGIYLSLDQPQKAIFYADKVLENDIHNPSSIAYANKNKSMALLKMGRTREAEKIANQSLDAALESGEIPTILASYDLLFEQQKSLGNFEAALEYKAEFDSWEDSLFNMEKSLQINELQTKYETVEKEKEIAGLNSAAEKQALKLKQKNIILLLTSLIGILIIGLLYFFTKQREVKQEQKNLLMQQKLLRSQMNPHFIFNALSAIQNFFLDTEDGPKAAYYLSKFAKLMRLILENSREDYIHLDQEIQTLENYLNLQKIRFNDGFDYSIYCDPNLDPESTAVPPMLAQPFIENSLEHGLLKNGNKGNVQIRFSRNEDQIEFTIEDNGIGREKAAFLANEKNNGHHSRATEITRDRLDLLNKKHKNPVKLQISDVLDINQKVSGTRVTFRIPFLETG